MAAVTIFSNFGTQEMGGNEGYSPCNFTDKNIGVGSYTLLQRILPTQGLSPGLPHGRGILYQLSHQGSPRILEWVAYYFSSGSSWPRIEMGSSVSRFFTNWGIMGKTISIWLQAHICRSVQISIDLSHWQTDTHILDTHNKYILLQNSLSQLIDY